MEPIVRYKVIKLEPIVRYKVIKLEPIGRYKAIKCFNGTNCKIYSNKMF